MSSSDMRLFVELGEEPLGSGGEAAVFPARTLPQPHCPNVSQAAAGQFYMDVPCEGTADPAMCASWEAVPPVAAPPAAQTAACPPTARRRALAPVWAHPRAHSRAGDSMVVKVFKAAADGEHEQRVLTALPPHPNVMPPPLRVRHAHVATVDALAYPRLHMDLFGLAQHGVPEAMAASVVAQLLQAVHHLHAHDVVHCDVKLENVLVAWQPPVHPPAAATAAVMAAGAAAVTAADGDMKTRIQALVAAGYRPHVVLGDFGMSQQGHMRAGVRGSPNYLCPEGYEMRTLATGVRVAAPYDGRAADVWSTMAVAAFLLTREGISWHKGRPVVPAAHLLAALSAEAADFIRAGAVLDPAVRPTAAQLLQHGLFVKHGAVAAAGAAAVGPPAVAHPPAPSASECPVVATAPDVALVAVPPLSEVVPAAGPAATAAAVALAATAGVQKSPPAPVPAGAGAGAGAAPLHGHGVADHTQAPPQQMQPALGMPMPFRSESL